MAMLRGIRESLSQELTLLYQLWGGTLTEDPMFFSRDGEMSYVNAQDFQLNHVISPTADSGLSTQTQRIVRAQELLKLAQSAPQLFNQHAVYERICRTLGIENIDEVLIKPEAGTPLDPVSENMRALSGAPLGDKVVDLMVSSLGENKLKIRNEVLQKALQDPDFATILMTPVFKEGVIHRRMNRLNKTLRYTSVVASRHTSSQNKEEKR
jgi:hypothetical protein